MIVATNPRYSSLELQPMLCEIVEYGLRFASITPNEAVLSIEEVIVAPWMMQYTATAAWALNKPLNYEDMLQ